MITFAPLVFELVEEEKVKRTCQVSSNDTNAEQQSIQKKRNKFKPPRTKTQTEEPLIEKVVKLKQTTFKNINEKQTESMMKEGNSSSDSLSLPKISFKRIQLTSEETELVQVLKKELAQMDAEIEELTAEKQEHDHQLNELIVSLHQYNDLKDAAQNIFGRLAELEGTTTKEMYKRYNLDLDD